MTPNWQHNSGKCKQTKGMCKGTIRSRKQVLQSLKLKIAAQTYINKNAQDLISQRSS
jgi:hypothetical protein